MNEIYDIPAGLSIWRKKCASSYLHYIILSDTELMGITEEQYRKLRAYAMKEKRGNNETREL